MKAPGFWDKKAASLWPIILTPASWLYRAVDKINRSLQTERSVDIPVICVGNIVAGGAGKTPVAIGLAKFFMSEGYSPHFLSRGYGGKLQGPVKVVLDVHQFGDVGDEPLLLAQTAPTWISKDRYMGAVAAANAGADVIIMDDGFQNPTLYKDFSVLVMDGQYGIGNGRLLPAGPLREPAEEGLARADAIIIVGSSEDKKPEILNKPVFYSKLVPHEPAKGAALDKVVAFAGIGRPEKFFASLGDAGCDVIKGFSFADHHIYKQTEIMKMVELAAREEAALVTTRKDFVRLSMEAQMMVTVFDVELHFDAPDKLQDQLLALMLDGNPE